MRQKAEWLWAPALHVVVVLVLYQMVWWGIDGQLRWFGWDCLEAYWPDIAYLAGSVREGDLLPSWNPYERGGYAFYADMHVGTYYPLTWILVALGALVGAVPGWFIQAKALAHLMIAGISMHAYLRHRGLHPAAAALAGVGWVVSVPMIIHKASALEWNLVWGPLIFLAIDRAIAGSRRPGWWRSAALLAASLWLSGAAGPPQGFFYVLVAALPYGLFRIVQDLSGELRRHGRSAALRGLALHARTLTLAGVTTGAMLLAMMVPASEIVQLSTRGQRTAAYPFHIALPIGDTLRALVAPRAGKVDAYCGIAVLALAMLAVLRSFLFWPRREDRSAGGADPGHRSRGGDRWGPVFHALMAAFALSLTFGSESPFLPFLVEHLPAFELFREPNRYKCLAAMLLMMLAAHGLDAVITLQPEAGWRQRWRQNTGFFIAGGVVIVGLLIVALILKATASPAPGLLVRVRPGWWLTFAALLGGGGLLAVVALTRGRARVAAAALLVALVYWDGASFGDWYVEVPTEAPVDDQEDRRHLAGLAERAGLSGLEELAVEWRVYDEFVMEQRPGSRLRIRNFRGYPAGAPFNDRRYVDVLSQLNRYPELVEAFNIRWVLHGPHHRAGNRTHHIKRPPSQISPAHFQALDGQRHEALHPVPMVAWYGAVKLVDEPAQALEALRLSEDARGRRTTAIVERRDVPARLTGEFETLTGSAANRSPLVAGEVVSFRADRVVVRIDAPARGVVVLNEKMFPGWHAEVDGEPVSGFRANYLLRAVVVEPGAHTIAWSHDPPRLTLWRGLFAVGLLFLLIAAGSAWRARRRAKPKSC